QLLPRAAKERAFIRALCRFRQSRTFFISRWLSCSKENAGSICSIFYYMIVKISNRSKFQLRCGIWLHPIQPRFLKFSTCLFAGGLFRTQHPRRVTRFVFGDDSVNMDLLFTLLLDVTGGAHIEVKTISKYSVLVFFRVDMDQNKEFLKNDNYPKLTVISTVSRRYIRGQDTYRRRLELVNEANESAPPLPLVSSAARNLHSFFLVYELARNLYIDV
ncbi:hypothetical protein MKW98_003829, partial [Papaver atlanticum]